MTDNTIILDRIDRIRTIVTVAPVRRAMGPQNADRVLGYLKEIEDELNKFPWAEVLQDGERD